MDLIQIKWLSEIMPDLGPATGKLYTYHQPKVPAVKRGGNGCKGES